MRVHVCVWCLCVSALMVLCERVLKISDWLVWLDKELSIEIRALNKFSTIFSSFVGLKKDSR